MITFIPVFNQLFKGNYRNLKIMYHWKYDSFENKVEYGEGINQNLYSFKLALNAMTTMRWMLCYEKW